MGDTDTRRDPRDPCKDRQPSGMYEVDLSPPDWIYDDDHFQIKVTAKDASGKTDTGYSGNARISAVAGGKAVTLDDHDISSSEWEDGVLKTECRDREVVSNPNSVDTVMDVTVREIDVPSCGRTGSDKLTLKVAERRLRIEIPGSIRVGEDFEMSVKVLNADSTVDTTCDSTFNVTEDGVGHLHLDGGDLTQITVTDGEWTDDISYVDGVGVEELCIELSETTGDLEEDAHTVSHQNAPSEVPASLSRAYKLGSVNAGLTEALWCSSWDSAVGATPVAVQDSCAASRDMESGSKSYSCRGYLRFDVQAYSSVSQARLVLDLVYSSIKQASYAETVDITYGFSAQLLLYYIDLGASLGASEYGVGFRGQLVDIYHLSNISGAASISPTPSFGLDPSWVNQNNYTGIFLALASEAQAATPPFPADEDDPLYLQYEQHVNVSSARLELVT